VGVVGFLGTIKNEVGTSISLLSCGRHYRDESSSHGLDGSEILGLSETRVRFCGSTSFRLSMESKRFVDVTFSLLVAAIRQLLQFDLQDRTTRMFYEFFFHPFGTLM